MTLAPLPTRDFLTRRELGHLEPWLDKRTAAEFWKTSERWLEYRMEEGMPHAMIAGRIKFRPSECEPWMVEHGYMERR